MATLNVDRRALEAARENAADERTRQVLDAMLASNAQQDQATRWILRLLGLLLVGSILANISVVVLVLNGTLKVETSAEGASLQVEGRP